MTEPKHPDGADAPQDQDQKPRLRVLFHDLRHCLHTLRTGLQILKMAGYDEDKFGETFSLLEQDGKRAAQLVDELVQFTGESRD